MEWLKQWKWCASSGQKTFYAVRGEASGIEYKRRIVQMHRQIMGKPPFKKAQIDHINGNGLDNRRANLRWCEHKANRRNEPKRRVKCSSVYKGVFFRERNKVRKWGAQIKVDGRAIFLGHFLEERDAAEAYNIAARKHFGEFANINNF